MKKLSQRQRKNQERINAIHTGRRQAVRAVWNQIDASNERLVDELSSPKMKAKAKAVKLVKESLLSRGMSFLKGII